MNYPIGPDRGLGLAPSLEGTAPKGGSWLENLQSAARLLSVGSLFLLAVGLLALLSWGLALLSCFGLTIGALVFHAAAWWYLGVGAFRAPRGLARALTMLFGLSVGAFVVAFGRILANPTPAYAILVFPYLPSVWAPVVVAHALLFLAAAVGTRDRRAVAWTSVGAAILLVLAVPGIAVEGTGFSGWMWALLSMLAGLTTFGYACIGIGMGQSGSADDDGWITRTAAGPPRSTGPRLGGASC